MAQKLLNPVGDITQVSEIETPEAKQKRLFEENIQTELQKARQKEIDFENLAREQFAKNLEYAKKHDTKYFGTSFDKLPQELQDLEIQRMDEDARQWAKKVMEDPSLATKDWRLYVHDKQTKIPSFREELSALGPEGEVLVKQFEEAGIDVDTLTKKEATEAMALKRMQAGNAAKPPVSAEGLIGKGPQYVETESRYVDLPKLRDELQRRKKFEKTMSSIKQGAKKAVPAAVAGLGAINTASDVYQGNIPEAVLDVAEPIMSMAGKGSVGKLMGRVAPGLELLRAEPTVSEEQEDLKQHRFKLLKSGLQKKGLTPELEESGSQKLPKVMPYYDEEELSEEEKAKLLNTLL